jgi:hypothetical protein
MMMMMMGMCIGFRNNFFFFFQICHVCFLYDFLNFIKKNNQFEENFERKGAHTKIKKRKLKKKIIKIYIF